MTGQSRQLADQFSQRMYQQGYRAAMKLMAQGLQAAMDDAQFALENGSSESDALGILVRELSDVRQVAEAQS